MRNRRARYEHLFRRTTPSIAVFWNNLFICVRDLLVYAKHAGPVPLINRRHGATLSLKFRYEL